MSTATIVALSTAIPTILGAVSALVLAFKAKGTANDAHDAASAARIKATAAQTAMDVHTNPVSGPHAGDAQ